MLIPDQSICIQCTEILKIIYTFKRTQKIMRLQEDAMMRTYKYRWQEETHIQWQKDAFCLHYYFFEGSA